MPLPSAVRYRPQEAAGRATWKAGAPVALLLFYRAHLQAGNTAVFDAMLEKAMRLSEAAFGAMFIFHDDRFIAAALRGVPEAYGEFLTVNTTLPGPGTAPYRFLRGGERSVIEETDLAASDSYRAGDIQRRALVDIGGARSTIQVPLCKDATERTRNCMSLAVLGSDSSGKFQVTRAPTVPIVPQGPRKLVFLVGVLVAAVAGGLGAAYLRGAIRGIMVSPRELEMACQLPVIGTVSWEPAWSTHHRRRRGLAQIRRVTPKPPRRPALGWLAGRKIVREAR